MYRRRFLNFFKPIFQASTESAGVAVAATLFADGVEHGFRQVCKAIRRPGSPLQHELLKPEPKAPPSLGK